MALLPLAVAVAVVALLLALAAPAASPSTPVVLRLAPTEDVSLPFGCDWAYDWEARCFRHVSSRLPIGAEVDKAWGAALRFRLDGLPPGVDIQEAMLALYHDGTCFGPRGRERPCDARTYRIEAYAILDPDWTHEREVALDRELVSWATLYDARRPGWIYVDITPLFAAWLARGEEPAGVLLRLAPGQEVAGAGGPMPASSRDPLPDRRPRLDVAYLHPP
jgi:hypothetical protein